MKQKKIAVINDISGYGRCSLTVALPVISALKIQCCPVPTAILSNHTGFPTWFFDDYTHKIRSYLEKWKEINLDFDGIISGFLGSEEQIKIVSEMIRDFSQKETKVLIDPIMGDHGITYQTYTFGMCEAMKALVQSADVVTPNLTEACILADVPYKETGWKRGELTDLANTILFMGAKAVVITGIKEGKYLTNLVIEKGMPPVFIRTVRIGNERSGTGDVFSSIVFAETVKGTELKKAVKKAALFVKACIKKSEEMEIPENNGVCFEELLYLLMK